MIDIIATAAVSGLLTGTAIGFSLARPWQDWTIKRDIERDLVRNRLRKSLEEARTQIDWLRSDARSSFDTAVALRIERDEARAALAIAGKPDTQAVSDYMREIGARGNASQKRAKKSSSGAGRPSPAVVPGTGPGMELIGEHRTDGAGDLRTKSPTKSKKASAEQREAA